MIQQLHKIRRLKWQRGTNKTNRTAVAQRPTILLLTSPSLCRRLAQQLADDYELIEADAEAGITEDAFDLAICDREGLRRWTSELDHERLRQAPAFLPVVLLATAEDLSEGAPGSARLPDAVLPIPLQADEVGNRVTGLLRRRASSLRDLDGLDLGRHPAISIPDRRAFLHFLATSINDAARLQQQLHTAVVRISMSRIRQSLGYQGLEQAAAECSLQLLNAIDSDTCIARVATEEWALLWQPDVDQSQVLDTCERIRQIVEAPILVSGEHLHLSPKIGIGRYPEDGADADHLLNNAIAALCDAQSGSPSFYDSSIQHKALRFIRTQARLHKALELDQFELWFQPQLCLSSGQLSGMEALIRWRLPDGNMVPPVEFIPVAEATGQIAMIDRWVLREACATLSHWRRRQLPVPRISVNITVADVETPDFVEFVQVTLSERDLPPACLELEITETAMLEASPTNLEKLNKLRNHGVSIAVDDFGMGYSSLGYLHQLPVSTLKIDKAFVQNVIRSDSRITETIVWLAQKFDLDTVAEGIETPDQAEFLKGLQVTTAQGYLYGRPMPEEEARAWVSEHAGGWKASTG